MGALWWPLWGEPRGGDWWSRRAMMGLDLREADAGRGLGRRPRLEARQLATHLRLPSPPPPPPPSLEICCRACMGFYRWVMVAATGGVGVAATLCLCSLLIWPIRLRSCESSPPCPHWPRAAGLGQGQAPPSLTTPTPFSCRGPWSPALTPHGPCPVHMHGAQLRPGAAPCHPGCHPCSSILAWA